MLYIIPSSLNSHNICVDSGKCAYRPHSDPGNLVFASPARSREWFLSFFYIISVRPNRCTWFMPPRFSLSSPELINLHNPGWAIRVCLRCDISSMNAVHRLCRILYDFFNFYVLQQLEHRIDYVNVLLFVLSILWIPPIYFLSY